MRSRVLALLVAACLLGGCASGIGPASGTADRVRGCRAVLGFVDVLGNSASTVDEVTAAVQRVSFPQGSGVLGQTWFRYNHAVADGKWDRANNELLLLHEECLSYIADNG